MRESVLILNHMQLFIIRIINCSVNVFVNSSILTPRLIILQTANCKFQTAIIFIYHSLKYIVFYTAINSFYSAYLRTTTFYSVQLFSYTVCPMENFQVYLYIVFRGKCSCLAVKCVPWKMFQFSCKLCSVKNVPV